MAGYLIKDTTKEEREQLVAESLGNISASCDGCSAGIVEMYQAYIDGKGVARYQYGISCAVCIWQRAARADRMHNLLECKLTNYLRFH